MNDTRFKWLVSAAAFCIVAIAGMYFFSPGAAIKKEPRQQGLGEYVYIDSYKILHTNRKCTRLNYKGIKSDRVHVSDLSGVYNYCPKCVNDKQYEELLIRN